MEHSRGSEKKTHTVNVYIRMRDRRQVLMFLCFRIPDVSRFQINGLDAIHLNRNLVQEANG
jgi:hypothetical protein